MNNVKEPLIKTSIRRTYYPHNYSKALWYPKHNILEVDLGTQAHIVTNHAAIIAANLEQLVFGIGTDKDVVSVEFIGANFKVAQELEFGYVSSKGNIVFDFQLLEREHDQKSLHEGLTFDFGEKNLSLFTNSDNNLFVAEFGDHGPLKYYRASPHIMYGIEDDILKTLWVVNPQRAIMR